MSKIKISTTLSKMNLISGPAVMSVFDDHYQDILSIDISSPADTLTELWFRYPNNVRSLNGKVFEGLLATVLYRSGIAPLYVEAMLSFVPNVEFDFVAYSKENGPVILSAKTSLRERYKQADLEGMMVRQVHRKAKSYLITLDEKAAKLVNHKISTGQVLGLDKVVVATNNEFNDLIAELQELNFYEPEKIDVLKSKRLIK